MQEIVVIMRGAMNVDEDTQIFRRVDVDVDILKH